MCILVRYWRAVHTKLVQLVLDLWRESLRKPALIYVRTTKAQISLRVRAGWSAPLLFAVARLFSTKKRLTNLNGEQNDTWNLLVSHRIYHFRAIQPFDTGTVTLWFFGRWFTIEPKYTNTKILLSCPRDQHWPMKSNRAFVRNPSNCYL